MPHAETEIALSDEEILETLLDRYPGTLALDSWGETSIFYNPGRKLPRGVYFATLKKKDGENDRASMLDRPDIFRFNVGTSKALFVERFGPPPSRPRAGGVVEGGWDFTLIDRLTPHPVYGWMSWVAINNPSGSSFGGMRDLIDAAYEKAIASFDRKL